MGRNHCERQDDRGETAFYRSHRRWREPESDDHLSAEVEDDQLGQQKPTSLDWRNSVISGRNLVNGFKVGKNYFESDFLSAFLPKQTALLNRVLFKATFA